MIQSSEIAIPHSCLCEYARIGATERTGGFPMDTSGQPLAEISGWFSAVTMPRSSAKPFSRPIAG